MKKNLIYLAFGVVIVVLVVVVGILLKGPGVTHPAVDALRNDPGYTGGSVTLVEDSWLAEHRPRFYSGLLITKDTYHDTVVVRYKGVLYVLTNVNQERYELSGFSKDKREEVAIYWFPPGKYGSTIISTRDALIKGMPQD